jgi:hypothetical protein
VIQRSAVWTGREAILGLADRLDGPVPVEPRGIVRAVSLLTDGLTSPLFNSGCGRTVAEAVWEIADALQTDDPAVGFDAVPV